MSDYNPDEYDIVEKAHEIAERSPGYEDEHPICIRTNWLITFSPVECLFLGKLEYFLGKMKRPVYNTYEQWMALLPGISKMTLRRAIGNLEKARVVISYREKWKKFYKIDYDSLEFYLQHPEEYDKKIRK